MINQQYRFCPMCHNTSPVCQCNPTTVLPDRLQARYAPPQNQPELGGVEGEVRVQIRMNGKWFRDPELEATIASGWGAPTSPKKEWVGLTGDEAINIEQWSPNIRWAIIRTEAKLKEKNT